MESWTIKLPSSLSARVTRLAKRRRVSRSVLVREALELLASSEAHEETFVERVSQYVGVGVGLPADLSTNKKHLKGYGK
ncbi:MAG: CopG family transcriptional regulator [Archangium sp.]|nr:CopG family transcriptional regulator [Archangium sp.]